MFGIILHTLAYQQTLLWHMFIDILYDKNHPTIQEVHSIILIVNTLLILYSLII